MVWAHKVSGKDGNGSCGDNNSKLTNLIDFKRKLVNGNIWKCIEKSDFPLSWSF